MVLVKMLMKISPPTMRGSQVVSMATISPSRREVSPAESLCRRAKVLLPKFRLETAAHHPESLLYIFSRSNALIYQKMGARGWPAAASPRVFIRRPRISSSSLRSPFISARSPRSHLLPLPSPPSVGRRWQPHEQLLDGPADPCMAE